MFLFFHGNRKTKKKASEIDLVIDTLRHFLIHTSENLVETAALETPELHELQE